MLNKLISILDKIHWVASDSHTAYNKVFFSFFFKSLHNEKERHWKVLSREISHFHIQCYVYRKKKRPYMKKKSIMIPSGRTNKSIKIFSNIICKKRGNYRLDRCFASNTSEDMLQPINKYKKKN